MLKEGTTDIAYGARCGTLSWSLRLVEGNYRIPITVSTFSVSKMNFEMYNGKRTGMFQGSHCI